HVRKAGFVPFSGQNLAEAAARLEKAGMPASYRLSAVGQEYARYENPEELAMQLASRIGDPQVAPVPPLWPLLALVLLEWGESISAKRVLAQAREMGVSEQAQRGLVIVTYLFPELNQWLAGVPLEIPFWERVLAVPLAARKLVLLEKSA